MQIIYDPLGMLPSDVTQEDIEYTLGVTFIWLSLLHNESPVMAQFKELYDFPSIAIEGGEIAPDGTYTYPEDPPMFPLLTVVLPKETIHFYKYAMIASVEDDKHEMYRFS